MKNKHYLLTGASIAAVLLCAALSASAKDSTASPSPKTKPSPASAAASPSTSASPAKSARAIPMRGTASAVDQSGKTFTIAGKTASRVFKATDQTTITKAGNSATFADLTDNEAVSGSYWKRDDGSLELKSLKIGGKTAADASKTSKKSKSSSTSGDDAASTTSASPSPKKK